MRAGLQSRAQRGAGDTDGMYAEFKGTPAERSKGRKVSLAEQDRLLACSRPTGLNLTLTACASQFMPVCVQVKVYSVRLCYPDRTWNSCMLCASVCLWAYGQVHTSVGNEARRGCVIHISPHDRGCSRVPGKRSKAPFPLTPLHACWEWTIRLGSQVNDDTYMFIWWCKHPILHGLSPGGT